MKNKPAGRVVTPEMKWTINEPFFYAFTWRERVKILCGYNVLLKVQIHTQHKPGHYFPQAQTVITKQTSPDELFRHPDGMKGGK